MPPGLNEYVVSILERCAHLRHLQQLQCFLVVVGHARTHFYAFKLLRFAAFSLSDLPYARLLFDALPSPNVFLFTAMLSAYSAAADPRPALPLFARMLRPHAPRPNHFVYPLVLKSSARASRPDFMNSVHSLVLRTGFHSYSIVGTSLVDAYSTFSDLAAARLLFDGLRDRNVVSWTAMLSGYARAGMVGNALALFEEMPERDVPAWNAVIAGCTQNGLFTEAAGLFRRMVFDGVRPNATTVACVLSACGHLGMLRLGKWLHGYIFKNHIGRSPFVSNALVDMYGKCGSLWEAKWIFHEASDKSLTAWNSLINCLALHGHSEDAIATFREMELEGTKPDEVTFVGILNACTHGGLVDEGLGYFKSMSREYGIEPEIQHYGCVVDLLGRAGRFEEATDIIKDMRVEPDEVVWGSLLNGCRIYKDTELAEVAIRKLLEIDPNNAGYGVMLANLYSECGKWEQVGKVRKVMKEGGGKKLPGCSWIEVDTEVHQFHSGDKLHNKAEEICNILEGLSGMVEA